MNLRHRVMRGGLWVFSARLVKQLFFVIRAVILARILSPSDFGLFGIALLMMSALSTFSQTGFHQALIQKKEDPRPYMDTAWVVGIVRSVLIAAVLYLTAPAVAVFFNSPEAILLLKAMGVSILFQGFLNPGIIYLEKRLEFHKYFVFEVLGSSVDLVVAVGAALSFRSAWALMLGLIAGNFTRSVFSFILVSFRPRFRFNIVQARELFGFGRWIMVSSIILFLLTQGDDILVGNLLGAAALGLYQMAYLISNAPATEITHVISQVLFPAYSNIQGHLNKLRDAFFSVLRVTAFLSFPVAVLIFVLSDKFVNVLLGTHWMSMVPALKILCLFGITRALNATFGAFFLGIGRPKIMTVVSGAQLALLSVLIYPLTQCHGITGTAVAVVVPNALAFVFLAVKAKELIADRTDRYVEVIAPFLAAGVFMYLGLRAFQSGMPANGSFLEIAFTFLLGMVFYLCAVMVLNKAAKLDLMSEIFHLQKALRQELLK